MTNHYIDLRNADCVMIIGSNAAENHPISFKWITEAMERGAKLISVDPRFTRTSSKADVYAPIRSGTDIAFIGGIINYVLNDMKARDITVLDVRGKTSITDFFIIASGTSDTHVKSTAESVAFEAKKAGEPALGQEGLTEGERALVDLNGVVVHVMLPKVRDFYQLEKLWAVDVDAAEKLIKQRS